MTEQSFRVVVHAGDCLDVLRTLPENSIDSCVTDPPYHLVSIVKRFGGANAAPAQFGTNGAYARASRGFMNKQWDGGDIAHSVELWSEVLRVLKPGGHVLAFGGDRTVHRLICAIEDAGFEIRGQLAYVYGSGFPKSHNVSRALRGSLPDDALCACAHDSRQTVQDSPDDCLACHGSGDEQPLAAQESGLGGLPLQGDAPARNRGGRQTDVLDSELANSGLDVANGHLSNGGSIRPPVRQSEAFPGCDNIRSDTAASTSRGESRAAHKTARHIPDIERSDDGSVSSLRHPNLPQCPTCGKSEIPDGLGTALKPAMELIAYARKPLSEKGVAANVLRWGTGAINVGACRVDGAPGRPGNLRDSTEAVYSGSMSGPKRNLGASYTAKVDAGEITGRWPANLIHDGSPEVLAVFPETGISSGGGMKDLRKGKLFQGDTNPNVTDSCGFGDSGSAARFFYSAKADSDDRLGSSHPTVKPVDLMQYLVRLVTPRGGTTLDPFAGTGTTAEAAIREGCKAILIEREPEYLADIERRCSLILAGPGTRSHATVKAKGKPEDHGPLFGGPLDSDKPETVDRVAYGKFAGKPGCLPG